MVLSFKISKTGTRYKPKPHQRLGIVEDDPVENVKSKPSDDNELLKGGVEKGNKDAACISSNFLYSSGHITCADGEASFVLNLFTDGYSIVKPTENLTVHRAAVQENPKLLHPYDRASDSFFSAIESGRLPGDLLNDIPCKYVNGTVVCEVQDYRKSALEKVQGSCVDGFPSIHKICLRMSLENIVKDIPMIADGSWSYRDLMEVESRILKTLQPNLCLDPIPKLDRLCEDSTPELNLDLRSMRKKRLRQVTEVTVTCHTNINGKKVCIDRVPESSSGRAGVVGDQVKIPSEMMLPQNDYSNNVQGVRSRNYVSDVSALQLQMVQNQPRYHMNITNPRLVQDQGSGPVINISGASPTGQDIMSYTDNIGMSSLHAKRENHDGQLSPPSNIKKSRHTPIGVDGISQQHLGPYVDGFQGQNAQWKNSMLQQQLQTKGIQYTNSGVQGYQPHMFDGLQNQEAGIAAFNPAEGTKIMPKEEQIEMDKLDRPELSQRRSDLHAIGQDTSNLDPQQLQFSHRLPQNAFNRPGLSQAPWNSHGQQMEKREDQLQKRKSAQSPHLSAGSLAQSPLSSKSGEFSSGSLGAQFGVAGGPSFGTLQKDNKAIIATVPSVGGMPHMTSSCNDSIQRQQPQKRRTNSLTKTQAFSGVASPLSGSITSVAPNVNSPSIGTPPIADQTVLERFGKIEMITNRYKLNAKKNKVDNCVSKTNAHSPQLVAQSLILASSVEDIKDDIWPMSKSIVSGSMNAPKTRVMTFMQPERVAQVVPRPRTRLIMSEKTIDGTVAIHLGDIEVGDFMAAEDYLQTLPNAHKADLLAAQTCSLMISEGYIVEDHIQLKPMCINPPPGNEQLGYGGTSNEMQQYAEAEMNLSANKVAKPTNGDNASISSQNHLAVNKLLPPGNQALQMSQGLLTMPARPHQLDQQSIIMQQTQLHQQSLQPNQHSLIQQHQSQFQRPQSLVIGANNPLSHLNPLGQGSNMQLGNHMVNKPSPLQMQMLQQQQGQSQQQQQQQAQMRRKLAMGLGNTIGMGNIGNNLVGLGGLGTGRGMGGIGVGITSPVGPIASVGNVGQNPMGLPQNANINTISQQLRNGQQLTPQQAAMVAAKMQMFGRGMLGGPNSQSNMAGISGVRQMHPASGSLAMLGQSLNRANINSLQQRAGMGPMGPPKLMAGINPYMNQQQQLQLQQQQQQFQLQQQMQQQSTQSQPQQQPQQDAASPLQAVVSLPPTIEQAVSSPASMIMTQQQVASPRQQMSQQLTPVSPQLSSGAVHPVTIHEACHPASPQLSSQTLGSVGSISNSPMEHQGVNKSNSNA